MSYVVSSVAAMAFVLASATAAPALANAAAHRPALSTAMPRLYSSCAKFNAKYPHGVGKATANDKTKGTSPPVTTFKRSTKIYNLALSYNKRLDGDKDGV